MLRRARPVAAALTLVALAVSFSEMVWASTCDPAMAMAGALDGGSERENTAPDCPHALGAAEAPDGDLPHSCPFSSPDAAQFCGGIASMPAPMTDFLVRPEAGSPPDVPQPSVRRLLLATAFFRPPRA